MKRIAVIFMCLLIMVGSIPVVAAESGENLALNAFVDVSVWDKNGAPLRISVGSTKNLTDVSDDSTFQSPVGTERAVLIMDLYDPTPYNKIYLNEA